MEFILYFLVVGSALMYFILKFDTHQHKRMRKLYKDNENLQPLFLQKSAEQKLKKINTKLYGEATPALQHTTAQRVRFNGSPKGLVARKLAELLTDYDTGKVEIKDYNVKLTELLVLTKDPKNLDTHHAPHGITIK